MWYLGGWLLCGIHDGLAGNLGNLNKCVYRNGPGSAYDVQLSAKTACRNMGRCGVGGHRVLPLKIELARQVLQALALGHGDVKCRPNMLPCVLRHRWFHSGLDITCCARVAGSAYATWALRTWLRHGAGCNFSDRCRM